MGKENVLRNKAFLYATEFFAGMSVMAIELGASRLLAPYFSSSQIVWTIIIGTIMIAMALGNVWGGRMADRDPNPDRLYFRLIIAAVWTAAIPFLGKYILVGISGFLALFVKEGFLIWAAFVSCMVIFVFPLMLLGTVTPSLAKYTVASLNDSGKTVGVLGALNTIGSIIGTFVPTFVTIPAVGTAVTFLIFAVVLFALGAIYFISTRRKLVKCGIAAVLVVAFSILGADNSFAFWEKELVYEDESIYNYLQVKENDRSVILSTNVLFGVQSIMMKDGGLTGMYYDYALAAPFMAGKSESDAPEILILGLGTGTYASQCVSYFPGAKVEGIEIDEKIAALSREYFDLPDEVEVTVGDGRASLAMSDKTYDVIMVDAYQDITIPFQMSTVEFFTEVKEHLKENGVMVVNMNMHSEREGSINQYLADTIADVFSQVCTVKVAGGTNQELFAAESAQMNENLNRQIAGIQFPELKRMMEQVETGLVRYESEGHILTDDKAPVEVLGMKIVDEIITEELDYYRDMIAEEGIKGLIEEFQ